MYSTPAFSRQLTYSDAASPPTGGACFRVVAVIFAVLECTSVYAQYYAPDGLDGLAPGAFEGYASAPRQCEATKEVVEFMSLWVANNKAIFSMLLLVIASCDCARTRALAALATALGCLLYFARMDGMLRSFDERGAVRPRLALEIGDLIGKIFIPAWIVVALVEVRNMRRGAGPVASGKAE